MRFVGQQSWRASPVTACKVSPITRRALCLQCRQQTAHISSREIPILQAIHTPKVNPTMY